MRGLRTLGLRPARPNRVVARLLLAGGALAVGLLVAPLAQARQGEALSLDVTFSSGGAIAVTLPDGTPVGATGGSPTVIPAGYYTLFLSGPGGCTNVPFFTLHGPGVNISDNLEEGEVTNDSYTADFQPNATYTWSDAANSGVVYTFQTNSDVLGTPTATGSSGYAVDSSGHGTASSSDLIGSASSGSSSVQGTLTAAVSAAGKLSLRDQGKTVSTLPAGRYTVSVNDESRKSGFILERVGHAPLTLMATGKVGKRSLTVELATGQWFYASHAAGAKTYFVVVVA